MKTINDFKFEYRNGYYLVQRKYTSEETGKPYFKEAKTYPTKAKAKASIAKYGLPDEGVDAAYQKSYLKACMKKTKPDHFKKEYEL